jgi:lipid-binding SYLF domain-containing protein
MAADVIAVHIGYNASSPPLESPRMTLSRFAPRRGLARLGVLLLASLAAAQAFAGTEEDERAANATRVLADIQRIPEESIPEKLLDEGKAIIVIPDSLKVGLMFGGRSGHGLMSVKNPDGTWSQPVFVKLTGGSIGFQAGVQSSDIVLVFRNDRSLNNIVNGKFTLGADAGVAAGPVGRNASAATDGQLKAEIWSWSRARGLFAGIALDGAVLSIDKDANADAYGPTATPRAIFENRAGRPSSQVVSFRDTLEEATANARANRGTDARPVVTTGTPTAPPPVERAPVETAPIGGQPATTEPVPQQGFQPVQEGEIRTEPLN